MAMRGREGVNTIACFPVDVFCLDTNKSLVAELERLEHGGGGEKRGKITVTEAISRIIPSSSSLYSHGIGVRFFVQIQNGLKRRLAAHAHLANAISVLAKSLYGIEGSYLPHEATKFIPRRNTRTRSSLPVV